MPSAKKPVTRVGIASRLDKRQAFNLARDLVEHLLSLDVKVYLESRIASKMGHSHFGLDLAKMTTDKVDVIISVGGDGTILRVAQNLNRRNSAPILGVNVGSIGFLDEAALSDIKHKLKLLLEGKYRLQRASRLKVVFKNRRLPDALNEVYLCSSRPSKILKLVITIDGEYYTKVHADGIVFATASGSTAYSLSAGGAIIDPRVQNITQIVPVSPYAKTHVRPLVVPANKRIEVSLLRPRLNATLVVDGQYEVTVPPNRKISIRRSKRSLNFIRFTSVKRSFYKRLRTILFPGNKKPKRRHKR